MLRPSLNTKPDASDASERTLIELREVRLSNPPPAPAINPIAVPATAGPKGRASVSSAGPTATALVDPATGFVYEKPTGSEWGVCWGVWPAGSEWGMGCVCTLDGAKVELALWPERSWGLMRVVTASATP